MWAGYGSDDRAPASFVGDPSALTQYEALPRLTGAFFDGWKAVLLAHGATERFVYRREHGETVETVWPNGTFSRIVC